MGVGKIVNRNELLDEYRELNQKVLKGMSHEDLTAAFLAEIMHKAKTWSDPMLGLMVAVQRDTLKLYRNPTLGEVRERGIDV